MVVVNALILWYGRSFIADGYGDFSAFYTAGKLLHYNLGSKIYDQDAQWAVQQKFASKVTVRHKPLPYVRPAFEAVIFRPLAAFPYTTAYLIWTIGNVLSLFLFPFLLRPRAFPVSSRFLQGILCFSYVPVAIGLLHGQDVVLMLLIFTAGYSQLRRRSDFRAGLWFALGLIKFHLIVPIILILAMRRKGRVIAGFASGGLVLLGVSISIIGWRGIFAYPGYLWHLNGTHNAGMASPESMPNIRGLLTLAWGTNVFPAFANRLLAVMVLVGIAFVGYVWKKDSNDDQIFDIGFSIAIITTLLTSYYAYSYDMTLLILPFFLLAEIFGANIELRGWPKSIFFLSAGLLCTPLLWVIFFGLGRFYLTIPVMLLLIIASVKAMRVLRAGEMANAKFSLVT
jgi:hypothetical protein